MGRKDGCVLCCGKVSGAATVTGERRRREGERARRGLGDKDLGREEGKEGQMEKKEDDGIEGSGNLTECSYAFPRFLCHIL